VGKQRWTGFGLPAYQPADIHPATKPCGLQFCPRVKIHIPFSEFFCYHGLELPVLISI